MTYTGYQPIEQVKTASPSLNPRRDDYLSPLIDSLKLITIVPKFNPCIKESPFLITNNKITSNDKRQPINQVTSYFAKEYLLNVDEGISDYLQEQPHLILVLLKLLPITANYFKGDNLQLTIIKDPENFTLDKFAIVVNTRLHSDTAFIKLQELDDRCFQARIPNDILVHVEFF